MIVGLISVIKILVSALDDNLLIIHYLDKIQTINIISLLIIALLHHLIKNRGVFPWTCLVYICEAIRLSFSCKNILTFWIL
jgi:hypothetical protein